MAAGGATPAPPSAPPSGGGNSTTPSSGVMVNSSAQARQRGSAQKIGWRGWMAPAGERWRRTAPVGERMRWAREVEKWAMARDEIPVSGLIGP
jgi:hypothetical protein